jgi:hypothetical protein
VNCDDSETCDVMPGVTDRSSTSKNVNEIMYNFVARHRSSSFFFKGNSRKSDTAF